MFRRFGSIWTVKRPKGRAPLTAYAAAASDNNRSTDNCESSKDERVRTLRVSAEASMARRVLGTIRQKVMVNGLFQQTNYQALKKMLDATVMRHEAIASNLANVETPNYKRIDVESNFGDELSRAISDRNMKDIAHLEPRLVMDKSAVSPNRDGNTVQLDKELVVLQRNSMAHTMQTQFITGSLSKLRSAILGRNV